MFTHPSIVRLHSRQPHAAQTLRILALAFAAATPATLVAGDRHYVGPDVGTWNTPDNWSLTPGGPPGAPVPVNGDNVFLRRPTLSTIQLDALYSNPGIGRLTVDGGPAGSEVTLSQAVSSMYVGDRIFLGETGNAQYVQSLGTNTVGGLFCGTTQTGFGSYRITSGARLTVGTFGAGTVRIGDVGRGLLTQEDSEVRFNPGMTLGNGRQSFGQYELFGTTYTSANLTSQGIGIGQNGSGLFHQRGGTVNSTISLGVSLEGNGTYFLEDGRIFAGTIYVGFNGTGEFIQDAGTVLGGFTTIGVNPLSSGSYSINGGTLTASLSVGGSTARGLLTINNALVTNETGPSSVAFIGPQGIIRINSGGTLRYLRDVTNNGVVEVNGGTLILDRSMTGTGVVTFGSAAELTGGTISNQQITSLANASITKRQATPLIIDAPQRYAPGSVFQNLEGATTFLRSVGDSANPNLAIVANNTTINLSFQAPNVIGYAAALQISNQGRVVLSAGDDRALVARSIDIDTNRNARFDISDNTFVLQHAEPDHGAAQTERLAALVSAGRNGGGWSGTGILSTMPPQNPHRSVGVFNNDDFALGGSGDPILLSFRNIPLTSRSIIVGYTWEGDSNMDRQVDGSDVQLWIRGYSSAGTRRGWLFGDYNYDTVIDLADLRLLAQAYYSINSNVYDVLLAIDTSTLSPADKSSAIRTIRSVVPCAADYDDGSGQGIPDAGVTIDDLLYYLIIYAQGSSRADLDDGTGLGIPDGGITIDDLLYFLVRYEEGC